MKVAGKLSALSKMLKLMIDSISILSTKSLQPEAAALLKHVELDEVDFIKTVPVDFPAFDELIKLNPPQYIFTSKAAVQAFMDLVFKYNLNIKDNTIIYSLEGETGKALQRIGFNPLLTAPDAQELAEVIIEKSGKHQMLFFCSDIRRNELPERLETAGVEVKEVVIYKTVTQVHQLQKTYDGILFFSPSAVHSFFMSNKATPATVFFCIGNTTANTIAEYISNAEIVIADKPGQLELVEKVNSYYQRKHQL